MALERTHFSCCCCAHRGRKGIKQRPVWHYHYQKPLVLSQRRPEDSHCEVKSPCVGNKCFLSACYSEAMMKMGTAREAAWSFPPPTCMSWRVESSLTTGPYLTSERSPWASVSSPPPALLGTVRSCAFVWFQDPELSLCSPVGEMDQWVIFICSYCEFFVTCLLVRQPTV